MNSSRHVSTGDMSNERNITTCARVDQEKSFKHTHVEKTDFMFYVFIVIGNVSRIHKLFCNVLFYPSSLLIVTSRLFAIRFV